MKLTACPRLALSPLTGTWYRALDMAYWRTRLSTEQSRTSASRFSAASPARPGHRILYLGENHQVVMYEVDALFSNPQNPISNPKICYAILNLRIILQRVADFSDPAQLRIIGTTSQELTGNWLNHQTGPAPTQQLGAALDALPDLEGFVAPSSKGGSRNLVVFPDNLQHGSEIAFHNPMSKRIERLT
jgi:hypothetical protein